MPRRLSLAVFLVWATFNRRASGQPCLCSALRPAGLQVNCSSLNLADLPHLPADTTELHARDNRLTSVAPGLFDRLVALERVSLSGNPFHCDCGIQYLRNWLLRNKAVVSAEPTCASPGPVARRAVADLGDEHFAPCAPAAVAASCAHGSYGAVMAGMVCCLVVLFMWSLRLAKRTTFTLEIHERHSGFEADSLRSLKPRHRRRLHREQTEVTTQVTTEDLEEQLIHMELLPQVLDTLHKKHNIKIKAN
ncbi:glycoprotein IX (platelet) [Pungitius pungitius]|uniref:glycoprotein IX (platelet) n=1 Tax=Pungitius pungitius TaxID=134920 RepID=UPI002E151D0F